MKSRAGLPLVSIVTPSFNTGRFIEETILSIKGQDYPNIEHIVIDGASTDNTLAIIRKYERTYNMKWVSEPDRGQADAVNKGWKMAGGEIVSYINADDTYTAGAVKAAVEALGKYPDAGLVYGDCHEIDEHGEVIGYRKATDCDVRDIICNAGCEAPQPTWFLRKAVLDGAGYLDENLHFAFDFDLLCRISLQFKIKRIPGPLASFRLYPGTKTVSEPLKFSNEHFLIIDRIFSDPHLPAELKALRRRARSFNYLNMSMKYHARGDIRQARQSLVKAVRLWPVNILKPWVPAYLIISLLGYRVTNLAVALKTGGGSKKRNGAWPV